MRKFATLLLLCCSLGGCATAHLLHWSKGERSVYDQPGTDKEYIIPGATVVALPVTVVWDVATFPFQLIWGVYPYGSDLHPNHIDQPVKH